MLTKDDFREIRTIVREEVESEVGNQVEELRSDLTMTKVVLANSIAKVDSRVKNSEIAIKRELKKIQKDITYTRNFLDRQDILNEKRIQRIENHLGFAD